MTYSKACNPPASADMGVGMQHNLDIFDSWQSEDKN